MIRLSDKEVRVLRAIELNADKPMGQIRKETSLRDHSIRYCISRLLERGIIRKQAFINSYPLGFTEHAIYFSVAVNKESHIQEFLSYLIASSFVSWIARVGGDYQYRVSICAKHYSDVISFLDKTSDKFPNVFFEKSVSVRASLTLFERTYFLQNISSKATIAFGDSGKKVEVDERDLLILSGLANQHYDSYRDLARILEIPITTFMTRLKRLEKEGVIAGYIYQVDVSKLGMQSFTLLVFAKGISSAFRKKLFTFAKKHPHITYYLECLGSWDYELGLEVSSGEDIAAITQEIYQVFGEYINTIKVLPLFSHLKACNFPYVVEESQ